MENSGLILCDTDVIIEFYKDNLIVAKKLHQITVDRIAISSITAAELIYGALNKRELTKICKDIGSLKVISLNQRINVRFLELMKKYSLSHKLKIPDCIIAATAIEYNYQLFTLNTKDFIFIENIKLFEYEKSN
ncbi:MAG: type II toxin-antitoxin system VapC family toxin [Candidatus Kapabacteria bacterium]|nr:type II toxin-antitoxin system VapC family toxin [Candidatus Kapabacteria bacterium]